MSDAEKGLVAGPKTLWDVGQLTQANTAVALMQLVESGKPALDDLLGEHVPGLPAAWQAIALGQIISGPLAA